MKKQPTGPTTKWQCDQCGKTFNRGLDKTAGLPPHKGKDGAPCLNRIGRPLFE